MKISRYLYLFYLFIISFVVFDKNCIAQDITDDFFEDNTELEQSPAIHQNQIKDPLEKINRKTFAFYQKLDIWFLSPMVKVYVKVPESIRTGIANSSSNLGEPVTFVNAILAFSVKDFVLSFNRFFLNSTFGILGWDDYASRLKIFESKLEFSDIFRNLQVPEGPYFVSPFSGTSGNLIDALSMPQGIFMSPYSLGGGHNMSNINYLRIAGTVVSMRTKYDNIITTARKDSIDLYITQRNFFLASKKSHKEEYDSQIASQREEVLQKGTTYFNQTRIMNEYFE